MFLPAIPSWLSLWSLLLPEDALDANECSREGPERDCDGPRVGVSTTGTGRGGTGSVRLMQVIVAPSVSYRYAVVLHFWDSVSLGWEMYSGKGRQPHDLWVKSLSVLETFVMCPKVMLCNGRLCGVDLL